MWGLLESRRPGWTPRGPSGNCLSLSFFLCKMGLPRKPMRGVVGEDGGGESTCVRGAGPHPPSSLWATGWRHYCTHESTVPGGVRGQAGGCETGRSFWPLPGGVKALIRIWVFP